MDAVHELFEEMLNQAEEADDLIPDDVKSSLEEIMEKISQCKDYVDSVEFPTMFG